jgi:acyl carrier protein
MDRGKLESLVIETISKTISEPPENITLNSRLRDDLDIDSLDILDLEFRISRKLNLVLDFPGTFTDLTVNQLVDILANNLTPTSNQGS